MYSQALPSRFRGVYRRVARRLGVEPSCVSRVARQERTSEAVSAELKKEVDRILLASQAILVDSVSAQLKLALTLCKWARKARANGEQDGACLSCARQAADTAFRFKAKLKIEPGEYEQIRAKAERLRLELKSLDEDHHALGAMEQLPKQPTH